jgi:hypothetical protein
MSYLRLAYVREQMRATTFRRIRLDMVAVLAAAKVPAVLLRGGALVATVYADPAVRHCHDLAFLVQPADLARAAGALREAGLAPVAYEPNAVSPYAALKHETSLPVELHGRLFPITMYDLPWSEVWSRTRELAFGDVVAGVLAPADALLHVLGHAFHSASRETLRWVLDAWHIIQRDGEVDWEQLTASAERGRLTLPALVMLRYLAESLGANVPSAVLDRLEAAVDRAPDVERDVALRAARTGACESVTGLLRRAHGGLPARTLAAWWLAFPSREYVRDVMGRESSAAMPLHYVQRPINYLRARGARRAT